MHCTAIRFGSQMLLVCRLLVCLVIAASGMGQTSPGLDNGALHVDFGAQSGSLTAFSNMPTGHAFIAPDSPIALWSIELMDGGTIRPESAQKFSWSRPESSVPTLALAWADFGVAAAPELQVVATVSLDARDTASRWRIRVDETGDLALRTVAFPRLGPVAAQKSETLAVPQWVGESTRQTREMLNPEGGNGRRREWEYPGLLSMQCLTLYGEAGPGILVSTNDTRLLRKQFAVFGDGNGGLGLEVIHLVPVGQTQDDSFETSYDITVQTFDGDWYTAAALYRTWAQHQPWVKRSRIRTGRTPDWVLDTGLWVWNRGPSPGVVGPAVELQERARLPVSVFWHWWHGCAYDVGFPEYLPPREGTESFQAALTEAHGKGVHAIVYMNQRLWGMTMKSWAGEGAERYAVKRPDGTVRPEVYNTFVKAPNASMCMGTAFWRNKYATLAETAVRHLAVDGIYMDQACSSLACYDPSHGHPLGGGAYWMEGFQSLEQDIRQRTSDVKPVALAGEGCGEAWLPHLDMMLALQVSLERYAAPGVWEPIPFFHAVYHNCAVLYGNYSSLTRPPYDDLWPKEFAPERPLELLDRKFESQFRLEQARSFVWGQQPTIANFLPNQLEERSSEIDFLLRLARLRVRALKYLRDGVFLRPPKIDVPDVEIPMSRLSIYAGQQDAVQEFTKTVSPVLAGAWQAGDGGVAVVMVNISDDEVPLNLELHSGEYPIADAGAVYQIRDTGRDRVAGYGGGAVEMDVTLERADARVYEIVARRRDR